jgi:aspartyl-tRNA(Asn)/glutamyl-tRNA(Gln) amidotransferase subunit C
MAVTKKDVEYIAELARLKFSDDEFEMFTRQFNQILEYMDKLNELDTSNVEPLSHPTGGSNVFREDVVEKSVPREAALENAPKRNEEFFKVHKVI